MLMVIVGAIIIWMFTTQAMGEAKPEEASDIRVVRSVTGGGVGAVMALVLWLVVS